MNSYGITRATGALLFTAVSGFLRWSYADVTPISSSLGLNAAANAGVGADVVDNRSVQQIGTLFPLSTSVLAHATNGALNATTSSDATATWNSANSGQLTLETRFATDDLSAYASSELGTGSDGWRYTFQSSLPATLTLNYDIGFTGSFPYAMILAFNVIGNTTTRQVLFDVPSNGSYSFSLGANTDYTLQLFDDSNIHQYLPAFTADMTGSFSFQITPVPETNHILFLGFGMMLLVLARRGRWGGKSTVRSP